MEMNLPNKLTILRVLLIPVFLVVLISGLVPSPMNRYIAIFIFIVASLTDMLDGHIARSRNLITNFGKFMDPLADKLLVSSAMIAMVEMGDLPSWVVRILAIEANKVIAASWWGKIKTTTQMIMVIYLLFGLKGFVFQVLGTILIVLATIFTIISGVDYIVKNIDVLKE